MRYFFMLTVIFSVLINVSAQQQPVVGAIRWDAWLGKDNAVGKQVNATLGPQHWHYRLPFFAEIIDSNTVNIDGTSQEVMDQEIEYAAYAGLDYFAFLLYDNESMLSNGLHKFLSSSNQEKMNFCVILNRIASESEVTTIGRVLDYFTRSNYQLVLINRPLVYAYNLAEDPALATRLKDTCKSLGLPAPYIVSLQWNSQMPESLAYDAISRYWYGGYFGGTQSGAPYAVLMEAAQSDWQERKENGCRQVPLVSTGSDGRPRIENPVSWIDDPSFYAEYFEPPSPGEITTHLAQAFRFIEENPVSCEANAVLMYAWNENDEGGWLTPTLGPDGDTITARSDSLHAYLVGDYTQLEAHSGMLPASSKIYPQPICDQSFLYLEPCPVQPSKIIIYDSLARKIASEKMYESPYPLGKKIQKPGIYFYLVSSNKKILTSGLAIKY